MHYRQTDLARPETWIRYKNKLCRDCDAGCCSLPVEVNGDDLVRMGYMDEFELTEKQKQVAKRLRKAGIIEHFHQKTGIFTLSRMAGGECCFLEPVLRRCTIYDKRPDTCRNHPQVGPRSGFCAYSKMLKN